jgi:FixJ family two-component response regulator
MAKRSKKDGTLHLLRSPANAAHLLASIAEANAGKLEEHSEFERQMKIARRIMKKRRNALRELAKR